MERRTSPTVDARNLRRRFVATRRAAGFETRKAAADALGFSLRKLDLIENGERSLLPRDVDGVLAVLDVPDDEHAGWRRLAEGARTRGWWDRFSEGELPSGAKQWAAFEWGARSIHDYSGPVVPGLLQTDAYTAALITAGLWPSSPEEERRFATVKAQRRAVLDDPDPLAYHVIFDESVLHRDAGPDVMAGQIAHILDAIDTHPNITMQVVSFSAGLYGTISGAFTLVDFGIEGDDGIVNVEPGFDYSLYIEDFAQIAGYSRMFQRLAHDVAASPADTVEMLQRAHARMGVKGD